MGERDRLVREFAPKVYHIVRRTAARIPATIDREQLFNAGMLGLLDAFQKYDPKRGIPFEGYARLRIKGAILDELRDLDHLTRRERCLGRMVRDTRRALEAAQGGRVADEAVAQELGLSVAEVLSAESHYAPPERLDPEIFENVESTWAWEMPPTPLEELEARERVRLVSEAVPALPERNRLVAGLYYERELMLREIGALIGVGESRVSQILKETVQMIREHVARAQQEVYRCRAS